MSLPRILIVEDDLDWEEIYRRCLRNANYDITSARKISTAFSLLEEQSFDVILTDLKMLGGEEEFSGFEVLETAKSLQPNVQVIVITGYGSADHALRSMGNGAYDYITKDRDLRKKLALAVRSALQIRTLKQELLATKSDDNLDMKLDPIIGNSSKMQLLFEQIASAASSDTNVLIYGESGTGKQLIAKTIHAQSRRRNNPCVVIDCGHLSASLLEQDLFGDVMSLRLTNDEFPRGKFEYAIGGTLILEGIGDIERSIQNRLIQVIHSQGLNQPISKTQNRADVRIIATTDKNLVTMALNAAFDRRLFDVLNEFAISVPPLRERKDGDDIPTLAAMFLRRFVDNNAPRRFAPEAVTLLRNYDYPGNVGELESAIKYALTITKGEIIGSDQLRSEIRNHDPLTTKHSDTNALIKDPNTLIRICPLNMSACNKKEEIIRLFSPKRIFVNIPERPEYAKYEAAIRSTLESYHLIPILPKDSMEPTILLCNVCKLIQTCKYSISDISFSDTSVLYRLGKIQSTGLHSLIIKNRQANELLDIQGLFTLDYIDIESMEAYLSKWIVTQVKEAQSHNTYVGSTQNRTIIQLEIDELNQQVVKKKRHLLKLQERRANFIDPRTVPLDLEESLQEVRNEIFQIENQLAQLHMAQ
jgi:DNA-binding NtrC family response regulator